MTAYLTTIKPILDALELFHVAVIHGTMSSSLLINPTPYSQITLQYRDRFSGMEYYTLVIQLGRMVSIKRAYDFMQNEKDFKVDNLESMLYLEALLVEAEDYYGQSLPEHVFDWLNSLKLMMSWS